MHDVRAAHPRLYVIAISALTLAASSALIASLRLPLATEPLPLVVGLALMAVADLGSRRLAGGGSRSAATAMELGAMLLLGPVVAWLAAGSAILVGAIRRRSAAEIAVDAARGALAVLAAAGAFAGLGGAFGAIALPGDLPALAAAAAAHLVVQALVCALALGFSVGPDPWRAWQRAARRGLAYQIAAAGLGCLGAVALLGVGVWSLPLFVAPVLAARHAVRRDAGIRDDLRDFVKAMAEVLDEVDPYTRQHSARVAEYAVRLARAMGCSEREVEDLEYAALVHDLGKIGPQHQRILHKPGGLSHEEQRTMRSHPAAGAGIIGKVHSLSRAAEIVRLHHERPDGRGYPLGLRAEQTPLGARILNVADAFDAMTSDRPYRPALEVETALRELRRGAGAQFDREVVECLDRLWAAGRFPRIEGPGAAEVRLLRVRVPGLRV